VLLYKYGVSSYDIGLKFNTSNTTILNILREQNTHIRNNKECQLVSLKNKKHLNGNYKHGKCCTKHYCVNCGKEIDKIGRSTRCNKCAGKILSKLFLNRKVSEETKMKIGIASKKKFTKEYKQKIKRKHNGRKKKESNGYYLIKVYKHPYKNQQNDVFEHRLVVESNLNKISLEKWVEFAYLGNYPKNAKFLTPEQKIHHIDYNRKNNLIDNLYLCKSLSEHRKLHTNISKLIPVLLKMGIIKFKKGNYEIVK